MLNKNRMPPNAHRVFKGKLFEVWQWEQTMFDGSTATFERLKRPDTVQILAVVDNKILMQTEQQPDSEETFLSIPGGRVDEGEDPLDAAKRELLEESGYVSDDWSLWREDNPVAKIDWTVYTYIARNAAQQARPHPEAGEKIESRLVDFEEFVRLSTEDPSFYSPELVPDLLRMRLYPERMEEFLRLLFGQK